MANYTNIHGRRGGRGWRPYLLIPKYLAIGANFGGLLAAMIIPAAGVSYGLDAYQQAAATNMLFDGLIFIRLVHQRNVCRGAG